MTDIVEFNGIVISDFFQVIDVQRPMAGRANTTQMVSGMDGLALTGSSMNPVTIGVTVIIPEMSIIERREKIRELSMMLHSDGLAPLKFASDNGLYYRAILDGDIPVVEHVRTDKVTFVFSAESPILYGIANSVTVPSGSSVTFFVGGTYRTRPKIRGTVEGNQDNLWGVRIDNDDALRVDLMSDGQKELYIDCDSRVVTVQGEVTMIEAESDWIEMSYGQHTIQNDVGSGSCTVEWVERWV